MVQGAPLDSFTVDAAQSCRRFDPLDIVAYALSLAFCYVIDRKWLVSGPEWHMTIARWVSAVLLIVYGFAKLNGSQFTVLDSEISKPMGDVSGFWLTWYYFGYSKVYGTVIALTQIGGAILITIPQTALAGALLLLPVVVNIILIDVFFGVEPSATVVALIILTCLLIIIEPHARRLWKAVRLESQPNRGATILRSCALVVVIVFAWGFTWWVANYNNRFPTPIDGVWSVVAQSNNESHWTQVFFERNRASLAVFRSSEGRDDPNHFEIDSGGTIRVWDVWLSKGDLLMQGRIDPNGRIELVVEPSKGGGSILLQRRQ